MNISPIVKKNILYIRDSGGIFGAERVILTTAKALNKDLFNLILLCMNGSDGKSRALVNRAIQLGISVKTLNVRGKCDLAALIKMRRMIKKEKIDIIHSHDYKSNLYGMLSSIGLPIKRILTAHGSTRDSILKKLYLFLDSNIVYRFYDLIIAVSEDLYLKLTKKGIKGDHLSKIQNGLDLAMISDDSINEKPLNLPQGANVFAVIGRLFPDKGHKYFLEAFAELHSRFSNIFCLIVGEGPWNGEIRRQIKKYNLDNVILMCGVRNDMANVYSQINYLVIPSLTEGLPYVLLEAMALGIPVVATSVGDIPRLIQDGVTGYLVSPGDSKALTEKMAALLKNSEDSERMAHRAKTLVEKEFSAKRMVYQIEQLYQKIWL